MYNDRNKFFTNYVDMELNNVNPNGENVVAIISKFSISFVRIVEIEFKMKLQIFFVWSFSKHQQTLTFHIFHLTY